ncbi:hypothetical protein KZJ38_01175 [Paraburkholderia edwinii]|uniref:Uncharacterized protein n=1 Tax=Paraburkholderia edwinii TaxID=2861782 RepID=A0ABX8UNV2_9BURK|nr:hypothetical protein [Paraburkholderia edwinii]QYD69042.1 hypothetical protein KZJ38_01175 [Paraburkholderia edwinii]
MSTLVFVLLTGLFVLSAAVILINLFGQESGIDYWNLDGEKKRSLPSPFDFLRVMPVLVVAIIVMAGCIVGIHSFTRYG